MNKLDAFADLNSPKHPNMNQITKMTKLKEAHLKVSNSRYMGVKYDPHNYQNYNWNLIVHLFLNRHYDLFNFTFIE